MNPSEQGIFALQEENRRMRDRVAYLEKVMVELTPRESDGAAMPKLGPDMPFESWLKLEAERDNLKFALDQTRKLLYSECERHIDARKNQRKADLLEFREKVGAIPTLDILEWIGKELENLGLKDR